jgi:CRISPR/Cas system CSM-associated protein Csm2 small subunit
MLDFERKDNLKATFELIRLRRNFKLEVNGKNQDKSFVNVPLEIIDVSIPHGQDYGLKKLATGNLDVLVHTYTFKHTEEGRKNATMFTFKAPSLQYQLKDLHDLLFYQNEYPWYDMKYEKRMIRYFMTLFLYQLVEEISKRGHTDEMKNVLEIIRDDYFKIIQIFKTCVDNNGVPTSRVSNANTMSSLKTTWLNLLYEEYLKIFDRISKKTQEDVPKNVMMEMTRLKKFLKNIINMFEKMLMDIEKLLQHYADSQTRMHDFYDRLFVRGQTDIL